MPAAEDDDLHVAREVVEPMGEVDDQLKTLAGGEPRREQQDQGLAARCGLRGTSA